MSEKLEKNLWFSIAELETVTPGTNPSIILNYCFILILLYVTD